MVTMTQLLVQAWLQIWGRSFPHLHLHQRLIQRWCRTSSTRRLFATWWINTRYHGVSQGSFMSTLAGIEVRMPAVASSDDDDNNDDYDYDSARDSS